MGDQASRGARLEDTVDNLEQAAWELHETIATVRRLADAEALRELAQGRRQEIAGAQIRAIIAARRLRSEFLDLEPGDPVWALLLELFASRLEGRRLSLAQLTENSGVRGTTATRWSRWLEKEGLVSRYSDPDDSRAIILGLTDDAADSMRAYLAAALRLSPWVL